MKILFLLLIFCYRVCAQSNETVYEIKYHFSQTMEIDENLRRSYPPEILEQIMEASSQSYEFILHTNQYESLIKLSPKIINSQHQIDVEIQPDLKWAYKNLRENYIVNLIEFDKNYYVKDSMQKIIWEVVREQKKILGYVTQKYFYEDENQLIEIWCADDINIANGPLNYSGNKNLILESKISQKNGAKLSYHFIAVEVNHIKEFKFDKGKPKEIIEKQDFDEIFSEQRRKIRVMNEGVDLE